eukprot:COSAG02_NODE_3014_length_7551_cov_83.019995_5_plen_110_part_00
MSFLQRAFAATGTRPDLEAFVASGLFEHSLSVVRAFETAGVEMLGDASPAVLHHALCIVRYLRSHPGCEAKVRGLGTGLAFAMEHSLDMIRSMGMTTGAYATQICELFI